MEEPKQRSSLRLFGWLNSGLLALLLGLGVVFKYTASAASSNSSSSALTTVILLLCVWLWLTRSYSLQHFYTDRFCQLC
jgi:hypothetical protein